MISSSMYRSNTTDCRIYVGNLPSFVRNRDVEDVFSRYGKIVKLEVKQPRSGRGPYFAFLEFDDPRDAQDAVRERDGYDFDGRGQRITVQFPQSSKSSYESGSVRGGFPPSRGRGRGRGPPRRSDYRVLVSGLPATGSWQDIKDHLREAGEVVYADVFRDGTGVVEFARRQDMEWAVKNLDDTQFKSHENEISYIRVKRDGEVALSRSRSPRPRSRSPRPRSRSPRPRSRTPRQRSRSPRPRSRTPRQRSRSPRPRSRSPRQRSRSPRQRSRSPRQRTRSPRQRSRSPRQRSRSPRQRSRSPRQKSRSPRPTSRSPSRSPRHQSRSPERKSNSPQRQSSSTQDEKEV